MCFLAAVAERCPSSHTWQGRGRTAGSLGCFVRAEKSSRFVRFSSAWTIRKGHGFTLSASRRQARSTVATPTAGDSRLETRIANRMGPGRRIRRSAGLFVQRARLTPAALLCSRMPLIRITVASQRGCRAELNSPRDRHGWPPTCPQLQPRCQNRGGLKRTFLPVRGTRAGPGCPT